MKLQEKSSILSSAVINIIIKCYKQGSARRAPSACCCDLRSCSRWFPNCYMSTGWQPGVQKLILLPLRLLSL